MKPKFFLVGVAALCAATFLPYDGAQAAPLPARYENGAVQLSKNAVKNPAFVLEALPSASWQETINDAYSALIDAKNAGAKREENDAHFVKAATLMQDVLKEQDAESPEALALLGHIYRHRGSAAYAQNYFQAAVGSLNQRDDLVSRLKLAILYIAGDAKYSDNAETWRDFGFEIIADLRRDIAKYKRNMSRQSDKAAMARLLLAEAMCDIIGGDTARASSLLKWAANLPLDGAEKSSISDYCELWQTVIEGRWLWEATDNGAVDEYLLEYCFDSGVYFDVNEANS